LLVLEHLSSTNTDASIPLYAHLHKTAGELYGKGKELEILSRCALLWRLHCFVSETAPMGSRLPWLKDSFISNIIPKVPPSKSMPVRPFFKVGKQRKTNNPIPLEDIKQFLTSENESVLLPLKRMILNPKQWKDVLPLLPNYTIFQPASESGSADFFLTLMPSLVQFQVKDGVQQITYGLIGEELVKTPYEQLTEPFTSMTLIFLGFNIASDLQANMGNNGYVRFSTGDKFQDKEKQCFITLTEHMEVIVLGQQLTHNFLGEMNANVICPPELLKSVKALGKKEDTTTTTEYMNDDVKRAKHEQDNMDIVSNNEPNL